ncbi:MAG: adenine phosphoribosyltransferase [Planctomycetes bacterium]|nr:adenine phosphoribosyltransferase [Planctomycetota bacterium]
MDLNKYIRDVPDFPKPGIIFKDITPLLGDSEALGETISQLAGSYDIADVDVVTGIESRGFIFGAAVAERLGAGFVPVRKPGKLPCETIRQSYELEYGQDAVEIHADAIQPGQRVLMVDDLLATGGTMAAACKLVERLGGRIVGITFVIELCFLSGRNALEGYDVRSLMEVTGE